MTLAQPRPSTSTPPPVVLAILGLAWLAVAVALVIMGISTNALDRVILPRQTADLGVLLRVAAMICAASVPICWSVAGLSRILAAARLVRRESPSALRLASSRLEPGAQVLEHVALASGRVIPQVLVGHQGVVVVRELPSGACRRLDGRWEQASEIGWLACESPIETAIRDAEAIRRELAGYDFDFSVRVQAVVVSDGVFERARGCGVIPPDSLGAYLAAMPPQRSLDDGRLARIADLLRGHGR